MAGILAPWGRQSRPRRALTYRNRGASTRRGKGQGRLRARARGRGEPVALGPQPGGTPARARRVGADGGDAEAQQRAGESSPAWHHDFGWLFAAQISDHLTGEPAEA